MLCILLKKGFWQDVLVAWCEYSFTTPTTKCQILAQPIWLNSHLQIDGKPALNIAAIKAGLCIVNDIVDENGAFAPLQ